MKKVAVILSGCGVYDGSEIQEAVFSLLSIAEKGGTYQCFAPNVEQHHVVDHVTGNEMPEKRNVLIEAARIARGDIKDLKEYNAKDFDGLVIPGGFGTAKNLTKWAFHGPEGDINPDVRDAILDTVKHQKPIAALCMGPTVVAKALEGYSELPIHLTIGTTAEASPYDIQAISEGMNALGAQAEMRSVREIAVDRKLGIISAPCYMMDTDILGVRKNIQIAITELFEHM